MTQKKGWWILDDAGDVDSYQRAPDAETAIAAARADGCEGELTAVLDDDGPTPRLRKPRASRATVPEGVHVELGMMAWLSCVDDKGRTRCGWCGRFCRAADFLDAETTVSIAGAHVCHGPRCWRCRGMAAAPYAGRKMVRVEGGP